MMEFPERITWYNLHKKKSWSPLILHGDVVAGFWLIGAWYNVTKGRKYFYGAYPPSYLDRVMLLFPDFFHYGRILHLFSGTVPGDGHRVITFDINPELKPNVVGDAVFLSQYFKEEVFDIILADPPYSGNFEKYGVKPFSKKKVLTECSKVIKPGGFLVWLDTHMPQWRKADGWVYRGNIGLAQSTNHAYRAILFLEKGDGTN